MHSVSECGAAVAKVLIVNADDFGQSTGLNRGIVEAFEHGIVTSASLMVRSPAAEQAARYARANPGLAVGLHLDLGEWVLRDGNWVEVYIRTDRADPGAVRAEVSYQLARFGDLVGTGPTHIDSHQHVHRAEPTRLAALEVARELNVPLRHFSPGIRYCGAFYGQDTHGTPRHQAITAEALLSILSRMELASPSSYATPDTGMTSLAYMAWNARWRFAPCAILVSRLPSRSSVSNLNHSAT